MAVQESSGTSNSPIDSETLAALSKRSHIHFPIDDLNPARQIQRSQDTASRITPVAARIPPARQHSPLNPHAISDSSRRRVRSVGTPGEAFHESSLGRKYVNSFATPPRGLGSSATRGAGQVEEDSLGLRLFSDEYNLTHEDPRILQDVQRALKLKARREARLSHIPTPQRSHIMESYNPQQVIPIPQPVIPTSPAGRKDSMSSDIDFGPSTSASLLHPVPASLDNGLTLDWSGFDDKSESRWKLPTSKRKWKDSLPPLTVSVDQLATAYSDKITRINTAATLHTMRKAKMTKDQLGRRYALLYDSLSTGTPLSMVKVVHWYSHQNARDREAIELAEPFTWLKHLDKRRTKRPEQTPWHLTALITEEFVRTEPFPDSKGADNVMRPLQGTHSPSSPPPLVHTRPASFASPTSSDYLLGLGAGKNNSLEDGLTFEPLVHSTRTSLDVDSRQSHESSFSSLPLRSSPATNNSIGKHLQGAKIPISEKPFDNSVFAEPGFSDDSNRISSLHQNQGTLVASSGPDIKVVSVTDEFINNALEGAGITLHLTAPTPSDIESPEPQEIQPQMQQPRTSVGGSLERRKMRVSLPSADRRSRSIEAHHRQEAGEERAYELKARLLDQMTAHNHRIRQLLNRVSVGMREYESVQSHAMSSLGIEYTGLPRELVEAFGHDPAAVTGATRRFKGWRAVDDIQHRLLRQREVFQSFLSLANKDTSVPKSVLDDPILALSRALKALELQSEKIAGRAMEVGEALKAVQGIHSIVKTKYNNTLSQTSAVYPELSYIIALEESYKDQYQQFWEFGMDTLTFLLDTVAPFWRNYGKPIGEDIRDFLIIPLYRNEFTGETKRYPILRIPNRSFRHWFGLLMFFFTSIAINIFQARTAASSTVHYKLPMIPYESVRWAALPFFWVSIIIQWWAVLVESIVVLVQLGVLVWWIGWSVRIFS